ncbi:hypothetical protein B0H13DRAFT_2010912 [Mycena leptocephala]|nr:hypothetical protein B0H13DRAFT_2010912 [Mycena leptocephala]
MSLPLASILPSVHLVLPRVFSIATETYAHTRYRIRQPLSPPYSPRQHVPFPHRLAHARQFPRHARRKFGRRGALMTAVLVSAAPTSRLLGAMSTLQYIRQDEVPYGGRGYGDACAASVLAASIHPPTSTATQHTASPCTGPTRRPATTTNELHVAGSGTTGSDSVSTRVATTHTLFAPRTLRCSHLASSMLTGSASGSSKARC